MADANLSGWYYVPTVPVGSPPLGPYDELGLQGQQPLVPI